ncbi:MAG: murein biosynthesis integral membrane protein MurJ [Proteobacteria bacterium]|nr:murein biosynthesis integral membrane protein MurJ [Burkholderiales bacterium]
MNLLRALGAVSSMTLVSRVLGLVRDLLIARIFGAGVATDAFFVAFKLPNLLRRVFAEGAFAQAFVPILAEYRNRRGEAQTRALVDHVAGTLGVALVVVTALGIVAAPAIVWLSAPGFSANAEKFALTVDLLRITFPYILFISLTALAAGILNTYSRFSAPALAPALLNVSFIAFALWFAPWFDPPVKALAWAVFVGGMLQLAFLLPFLRRLRMLPRPRWGTGDEGVRRVLRQMGPALFGVSVAQLSLLINTIFASFLVSGSVSWLYYADRLMEFPTGLLGVALGTILLPSLAKSHADRTSEEYSKLLDWGLRMTLMLSAPAAVALAVLSVPLVATLFHHGAFDANDVAMTRSALLAYSVGLVGLIAVKVLAPGFYARQDVRTPVKIALITLAATQAMNLLLVQPLAHAGLALAIALGACLNALLLWLGLRRIGAYLPQPGWAQFIAKIGLALALMAGALWWAAGPSAPWLVWQGFERAGRLAVVCAIGATVYFTTLALLGFRLRDFSRRAVS